ncbi:MAG: MATE family efflux transporter [Clostridia bacterium]|nr:MATE family efflux transporter [Clostridia bacterium]
MEAVNPNLNRRRGDPSVGESLFYVIVLIAVVPMILGLIGDFFCTRFLREEEVAVLGLTGSVDTLLTAMIAMFGIGAQAVCAKDVGAEDAEESSRNYTSMLVVEFAALVILSALVALFRYPIADAIGANDDIDLMRPAAEAILAYAVGLPGSALYYLLSVLLYMEDRTRRYVLYATLVNFAASLAGQGFVTLTGPTMMGYLLCGIAGDWAGLAALLLMKHGRTLYFRFLPRSVSLKRFRRMFAVGLPGGLEYVYYALFEFVIYLFVINRFSYVYMAVFELKEDIGGIAENLVVGMCILLVDRIGMAVGSGDPARIRREIRFSWIACVGASVLLAAGLAFVYPPLVEVFMGDNGANTDLIIHHARLYLLCTCAGLPFYVANNVFTSVYEVRELLRHAHLNYFLELLGFALIYGIGLGTLLGPVGLWIAYPLTELSTLLVNFILVWAHNGHFPRSWTDLSFPAIPKKEAKQA